MRGISLRLRVVQRRTSCALLLAACLAALLPFSAGARPAECPAIDPPAAATCPAIDPIRPRAAGLRVFLDRRTGRIRPPTLAEIRELAEARGRAAEYLEPIEVVVEPDGTRRVDLKGAFEAQVVVRRRPDGSLETRCLTGGPPAEPK